MSLPNDRTYAKTHEWVLPEGDLLLVGITDHAQEQLGDLVYVGDFTTGVKLGAGDTAGVVESVKAASDIYAPVAGEVVEFNTALTDQPELLNTSPYESWIFKLRPTSMADIEGLLDADQYDQQKDDN
ncbi:glycine cleavage system protein GcvH [Paenalcaligenes niemegkensis]|uniref:glycine cleavage system protein GcvH n=1 Tax=Paenalcaligenes niemegkensis TaxID=2895469 RepID=UPI001EE7950B|nr:glycine cleavage system protein GcvH [Paenalcaligenes niemegkensis]MCQ9617267.1 glycine cleavage system protein GcvH [Paenalcaligenes niemegkensis]